MSNYWAEENLIASLSIKQGEIEIQVGNGFIQWKYKDEVEWRNLISIDSLKGSKGDKGDKGDTGLQGIQGLQGIPGKNGIDGEDGSDGINGKSLEFKWNGTELGIRQEGNSDYQYVNLRGERGLTGEKGDKGEQGIQGLPGKDGVTPDMSEFEKEINQQYDTIKAKVDKIEQEDIPVVTPIVGDTLTLTIDKRQKTTMVNNTTIELPVVDKFTEIHLIFSTTEELTLIFPKIKWQNDINIEANKTYEFIFTYDDEWLGGCVVYK